VTYLQDIGAGGTWSFRRGDTALSVAVGSRLRVSAAEGVRAAVLADIGIGVASAWMFGPELARGDVTALLTDWSLPTIDLWAVYPAGRLSSAKARAFAAFVQDVIETDAPAPAAGSPVPAAAYSRD
jgi:DNA-binding transcriptional LysR family regulator